MIVLAVPLAVVTALAAGCGGSAGNAARSSTPTTAPGGTPSAAGARSRFTSCLEAHGVPASEATRGFGFRRGAVPASAGGSEPSSTSTPPTTSAAFAAAFQACRSELPARPGGGFQNSAAGRAYLQCLQLHGVTIPTAPAGSAQTPGGFRSLTSNPAFQAARTACAALAPSRAGPPGTTSTSAAA